MTIYELATKVVSGTRCTVTVGLCARLALLVRQLNLFSVRCSLSFSLKAKGIWERVQNKVLGWSRQVPSRNSSDGCRRCSQDHKDIVQVFRRWPRKIWKWWQLYSDGWCGRMAAVCGRDYWAKHTSTNPRCLSIIATRDRSVYYIIPVHTNQSCVCYIRVVILIWGCCLRTVVYQA